jgi:hypothetical protein
VKNSPTSARPRGTSVIPADSAAATALVASSGLKSAWARTIGSLSTYTTRASRAASWATSWTLGLVGMPVPMSRNWRIPASSAR